MYQPECHGIFRQSARVSLLGTAILIFSLGPVHAQAPGQDFLTNVTQTELRPLNATDGLPGFNPCGTGGNVAGDGLSCVDAVAGTPADDNGLLSGTNVLGIKDVLGNDTPGLFVKLGPGAVTDNMFGNVLKPVDPAKCGGDGSSISTLVDSVSPANTVALNCGNVRFDPATQGQLIPDRGNLLTSVMSSNATVDVFGVGASTDHTSKMQNAFVWNPTTGSVNLPTGQACAAKDGDARVCSFQSLDDVTTLGTVGKTASVSLITSWTTGQTETITAAGVVSSLMTDAQPTITWSSIIKQAEMGGTGGDFEITTSGSFKYNVPISGTDFFPMTQHPTGLSFADQSTDILR